MAPLPNSYNEETLAGYMIDSLGWLATYVGKTEADDYAEVVNDALTAYGACAVEDCTDIAKLRAIAKLKAWEFTYGLLVGDYDFSADGGDYKRSQTASMVFDRVKGLYSETLRYLNDNYVTMTKLDYINDPYRARWTGPV